MDVLFLTNIPSPYRVAFFNELGKYCNLTVLFERAFSSERSTEWKKYQFNNFQGIVMKGIAVGVDTALCPDVIKYLIKYYASGPIVVADTFSPTGMLAIFFLKLLHRPYYIEADGAFCPDDNPVKKAIKTFFIRRAFGYFSTSKALDEYFLYYGAKKDRIFRYPFSSVHKNDIVQNTMSEDEKETIKERLSIRERHIVLYVGQFIYRKGVDLLLQAWKQIEDADTALVLIGGDLTQKYKNIILKNKLQHVYASAFKETDALADYFRIADVFVLPTREDIWGLVVNEALSFGVPTITTKRCVAGLELIENGKNGFLYDAADVHELVIRMRQILKDEVVRHKMSEAALDTASKYTIEKMAEKHMEIFFN